MKLRIVSLLVAIVMIAGIVGTVQASTQPATTTSTHLNQTMTKITPDQCSNPETTVNISTAQTSDGGLAFSPSTIHVNKSECVQVRLLNPLGQDHDFDIRKAENNGLVNDVHNEFPLNSTWTNVTTTIQFPSQDAAITWFCGIPGHRAAGMEGQFIVGAGPTSSSKTPGFELFTAATALFAIVAIPVVRRKFVN